MSSDKDIEEMYDLNFELIPETSNEDLILALGAWMRLAEGGEMADSKTLAALGYAMCRRLTTDIIRLRRALGRDTTCDFSRMKSAAPKTARTMPEVKQVTSIVPPKGEMN
jgi:hypothetical protein